MTPAVLFLQGLATAASLFGYVLLIRGGVFGTGEQVSLGQGLTLLSIVAVYGYWPAPIFAAATGVRGALFALVLIDLLWAVLAQGLAGLAFCAIPVCPSFTPFSDIARYGSLIFGIAAAWTAWRADRSARGPIWWAPTITVVALTVLSFALQAANSRFPTT